VVGLSRAFLTAGPTALLLTLSAVDLGSSMELAYRFHSLLCRGSSSPALALARAQRSLIADGEPAASWSSFVLFGDPMPKNG
jgi:CHAT domain-containing protein